MAPGLAADGLTHPQFMGLAARVMRNVLVDHARRHLAAKRGGAGNGESEGEARWRRVTLEEVESLGNDCAGPDIVALHEALERLATLSDRQARVVEVRFFAGLSVEQTAEVLGVSPRTVESDWRIARAWLARELSPGAKE
jgi:RNA polymerase sigma factor (TIGR02999 family)